MTCVRLLVPFHAFLIGVRGCSREPMATNVCWLDMLVWLGGTKCMHSTGVDGDGDECRSGG